MPYDRAVNAIILTEAEALEGLDMKCRALLRISGDEFMARFRAGEFRGCEDEDVVECRGAAWLAGLTQLDSAEVAAWLKDAPARRNDELRPDSRGAILARMRAALAALPRQEDEPGAMEEMVREFEDWSYLRRKATTVMLGSEDEDE